MSWFGKKEEGLWRRSELDFEDEVRVNLRREGWGMKSL